MDLSFKSFRIQETQNCSSRTLALTSFLRDVICVFSFLFHFLISLANFVMKTTSLCILRMYYINNIVCFLFFSQGSVRKPNYSVTSWNIPWLVVITTLVRKCHFPLSLLAYDLLDFNEKI